MNPQELKNQFQATYNREQWINTLRFLSGNKDLLTVHLTPRPIELHTQEAENLVKSFHQIGILRTSDDIALPVFEIILADHIRIDHNRVGVNDFIKKHIIRDAVKGALATFAYDTNSPKTEWRFSFISKNSASDFFAEAEDKETNPKKFTYIFGNREQHRTAIGRFFALAQSTLKLNDFFDAFNVEPVSKAFFEEYKKIHHELADYLLEEARYRNLFVAAKGSDTLPEKEIRGFASRLMGRLVFLYFLQKKNWLGASSTEYRDGSPTFLSDLFASDTENQDDFYEKYLCPVFFNALNTADRPQDIFVLENGKSVCIPFLNGGLFEEGQEPEGHRQIRFPASYFNRLFDFFNGYNFTVYENSPDEHTIAVDPEMLGHIFENLIDYNKDTGAFYTPKEIVQYMTRESLIEYLNTHLDKDRTAIEHLVKDQNVKDFSGGELAKINQLLDRVKICDPAVGSGAFPMGMLHEIFNLKELIHFKLDTANWKPAKVKQNIIRNSIYGVDIDEGAVEIARLRFWLSLVVDEDMPNPLPNLDYRIMQGNSLVESFRGIDLSNLEKEDRLQVVRQQTMNFGDEYAQEITLFDKVSVERLRELVKEYFTANTGAARNKKTIKKEIDDIVEGRIHACIYHEKRKLKDVIHKFYQKYNIPSGSDLKNINLKSREAKQILQYQKRLAGLDEDEKELIALQNTKERPYFLWHLFFGDVLNEKGGFDIVIGNPPYGVSIKGKYREIVLDRFGKVPDYEIYYFFFELAYVLLKRKGSLSYIVPNTYLFNAYSDKYRKMLIERWNLIEILDCTQFSIFESATVRNTINLWKKEKNNKVGYRRTTEKKTFRDLISEDRKFLLLDNLINLNQNWGLAFKLDIAVLEIIRKINSLCTQISTIFPEISQGLIAYDKYRGQNKDIIKNRKYHYNKYEKEGLKQWLWGEDVTRYQIQWNGKEYIDYCSGIANPRKPKFFKGERLLIREITNPSIYSAVTNKELYNDPAIIIVKSSKVNSVKWLCGILNSKLATFYHFNHSPKATKGAFPKILVKDIKEFPIPIEQPKLLKKIEQYVDNIMLRKNVKEPTKKLESQIDQLVYHLYHLSYKEVKIIDPEFSLSEEEYEKIEV